MTGTWRAKVHTDPTSDPIAQAAFLVEDFVPERLELKLEPPTAGAVPAGAADHQGRPAAISTARRPPASPSRARSSSSRRSKDVAGLSRLPVRPGRRDASSPCASRWRACPPPTRRATPQSPSRCRPSRRRPAAGGRRDPAAARVRRPHHRAHASRCPSTCKQARIGIKPLFKGNEVGERRDGDVRGVAARRRRQARRRQGPQVGAAAPRPALAVVQPRRPVELRGRDAHAPDRRRHARCHRRRRPAEDRGQRRLGPLPPGGQPGRSERSVLQRRCSMPAGTRRRAKPTAPRCSTSRSTSASYKPGETAASRSPRAGRQGARSPC